MSHIIVHRIDALARRRIGRTAQIEALPPQLPRHDGNHWQLNRRGWVHAAIEGWYSERLGPTDPRLLAAREAAEDAGVAPDLIDDLTLDDLVITPEIVSGNVGGITFSTPIQGRPPTEPLSKRRYKILDTGCTTPIVIDRTNAPSPAEETLTAYAPGPAYLSHINVQSPTGGTDVSLSLSLSNVGLVFHGRTSFGGSEAIASSLKIGMVVESPTTMTMVLRTHSVGIESKGASAVLFWRHVELLP